ncbi:MAG: N-acetylmuramoyl-L-alanine amidase [Pseudomonadota bacterium]
MTGIKRLCVHFMLLFCAFPIWAQELSALSRVDTENSVIKDRLFGGVRADLALSQPVPFIINAAKEPNRIFIDFQGVTWSSDDAGRIETSETVTNVAFGLIRPGWTRLVLELSEPMRVQSAEMAVNEADGSAKFRLRLRAASQEDFDLDIRKPAQSGENLGISVPRPSGPLRVILDPGHGGVDPGAVVQKIQEKDLMLMFARELQDHLNKTSLYEVKLTREMDEFVSLSGRIGRARDVEADVFISLHADALAEGVASGITVYTLSERASDEAAAQLAREMDRTELLLGLDLTDQDDQIASILYDLARRDTQSRSESLADHVVEEMGNALLKSRMRPRLSAAFTVLKAPDMPSILVELGFITNPRDLANLRNPNWRKQVIAGFEAALRAWEIEDAARAKLLRK